MIGWRRCWFWCALAGFGLFPDGASAFSVASVSFMFSMHGALLAARIVYFCIQFFRDVDTELKSIGGSLIKQVFFGATCLLIQMPINWVVSQTPYYWGFSFLSFWFPRIILPLFLGWILIYKMVRFGEILPMQLEFGSQIGTMIISIWVPIRTTAKHNYNHSHYILVR